MGCWCFSFWGHFLENTLEEWAEICHAYVSWPLSQLISFWCIQTFQVLLLEASFGLWVLSLPASVCVSVCVCVCINHLLVCVITLDPLKLGSPNLDHRPRLRSLLFWGVIDLDLQGQILLQSQNLPNFELVQAITHHLLKLGPPNLDQRCKIPWLRSLLLLGDWIDMSNFNLLSKSCFFASLLHLWNICEAYGKIIETGSVPHPKWLCTNMFTHRVVSWTVEQSSCIISVTIAGFPVLDSAIGNGFLMLL